MDYVGQRPEDELTIHVYAGAPGQFTLYEDDGQTFDYEEGASRITQMSQEIIDGRLCVRLSEPIGTFPGAVERRRTWFVVHGQANPSRVELNGLEVSVERAAGRAFWRWDEAASTLTVCAGECAADEQLALTMAS